jgi:hypothetical protein
VSCCDLWRDALVSGTSRLALCGSLQGSQIVVANSTGSGVSKRTVIGMAFHPGIAAVRLWLRGRPSRKVWLSMLGRRQARSAGVAQFRYAALALAGSFCLARFTTDGAAGEIVGRRARSIASASPVSWSKAGSI